MSLGYGSLENAEAPFSGLKVEVNMGGGEIGQKEVSVELPHLHPCSPHLPPTKHLAPQEHRLSLPRTELSAAPTPSSSSSQGLFSAPCLQGLGLTPTRPGYAPHPLPPPE